MRQENIDRLHRLPKWARDEISHLERNNVYLFKQVRYYEKLYRGEVDTNTYIQQYGREDVFLPENSKVTFEPVEGVRFDVKCISDGILVHQWGGVLGGMAVRPSASNVIHVVQVPR